MTGAVTSCRTYVTVVLALFLAQPLFAASVSGTVRDASGVGLDGMVVAAYTATGTLQATVKTDFSGHYSIDVPAGDYRLLAYDLTGGFATTFAGDADSFDTTPILSLSATQSLRLDFTLVRGGNISGQVLIAGIPVRDVVVAAYNLSGTRRGFTSTDANGRYNIVLPPGEYKLVAFHNSGLYAPQFYAGRVTFGEADRVPVVAKSTTGNINFTLSAAASIGGVATDTSGRPLAGIRVIAYTLSALEVASATTDINGRYLLAVPAGSYKLIAADLGGTYANAINGGAASFSTAAPVTVASGEFRNDINFTLILGGRISGVVVDRASNTPLQNVIIAVYNLDGTQRANTRSDASGRYSIVVPPGSYKVVAYDEQGTYAPQFHFRQISFTSSTILTTSGSAGVAADFDLERAGHISGRVLSGGVPVSDVVVAAYTPDGVFVAGATTDQTGRYDLTLTPGFYKVVIFDPQLRFATAYSDGARTFDSTPVRVVTANQSASLDLSVVRGVLVSGIVTDRRGIPLPGIEITAFDIDGRRIAVTTTGPDGRFAFALAPDTYRFLANDPLRRFSAMFLGNVRTLRESTLVSVTDTSRPVLSFSLDPLSRHHAVVH